MDIKTYSLNSYLYILLLLTRGYFKEFLKNKENKNMNEIMLMAPYNYVLRIRNIFYADNYNN